MLRANLALVFIYYVFLSLRKITSLVSATLGEAIHICMGGGANFRLTLRIDRSRPNQRNIASGDNNVTQ